MTVINNKTRTDSECIYNSRGISRKQLIKAAWEEYRVAAQYAGTSLEDLIDFHEIPDWYFFVELGFGFDFRPSLEYTINNLKTINKDNLSFIKINGYTDK